jgi:acetate kinase
MRELLGSEAPEAREAVDLFAYHCTRQIAAMAAALGGIDALVFSGGIGENAAAVRERICAPLGFLAITLDAAANARNAERIGGGRVPVLVLPTDEEVVIARACRDALAPV